MAGVPLQVQLFDAFLGTQEGIHSIILPDIFSSGGSKNLFIDKYGRTKKISGYVRQNGAAVTSNTGAAAELLRGLFPYKSTTGGSTTRQTLGVFTDDSTHWEFRKSTDSGATWTFVSDLGATAAGQIPIFAQFANNCYMAWGKGVPKVWNGTALSTAGSTQSPTPTAVASASVGQLSGNYTWKLISKNADGSRKYASVVSSVISLQAKQAALSWTQDADATVLGYEIYRTTGQGEVYYYVDYVDGRATIAYTDNITDLTILQNRVMEEHGDPPPSVYFAVPHKQRIWWLKSDTYPYRGWFSDAGLPDSVLTAFNLIDFSDSETVGDVITGGVGNYEGMLVVTTERAVWTVSGTGQVIGNITDWTRTRTNAQTGCVSQRTIARIPAGSRYSDQKGKIQTTPVVTLAYLTPLGDIRLFDGDNDLIISHPVKTALSTLNYAQRAKVVALHDSSRSEVVWCYPSGSSGENNAAVVWNYRWGVWYTRDWAFACMTEADDATTAQVLLAGAPLTTTGGFCYQLWSGNSNNGSAINAIWMTKTLYGVNDQGQPALSLAKRWRWVDFLFETQAAVTITVEWLQGNTPDNGSAYGSTTITPTGNTLLTMGGDTILTASGDMISVAQSSSLIRAILQTGGGRFLHDEGIRLRISDNASTGSWSLESMALAYQMLQGLGRRMQ